MIGCNNFLTVLDIYIGSYRKPFQGFMGVFAVV